MENKEKEQKSPQTILPEDDDSHIPPCYKFFRFWRKCSNFQNYSRHKYIFGEYPDCDVAREAMFTCIQYRATKNKKYKEELEQFLRDTYSKETCSMKPSSSVWEFRKDPATDWWKKASEEATDNE